MLDTKSLEDLAGEDIIDSRQIIERISELGDAADEEASDLGCAFCQEGSSPSDAYPSLCVEHGDELAELRTFAEEAAGYMPDWEYGETLIRDSYFVDYAQELADDIGAVNSDSSWPNSFIDWDRAAETLKMDYTSIELRGVTYWGR